LDAPVRKLEYYGLLSLHFEVQADWPSAIWGMKEGLQLAVQLNNKGYILFLSLALARYYTYANLLNQAKIQLERGARLFFERDIPRYYSECFLTFSIYWLAVNHFSNSAECFVYFLRLDSGDPNFKSEADRLSLALESHLSAEELNYLKADLPEKESKELIAHFLDELVP